MPNAEVDGDVFVARRRRVKYEKSSDALGHAQRPSFGVNIAWIALRVRAVRERHEREEQPVIVSCWVCVIFNAEPGFNFGPSAKH